ncbi:hypothetical protein AB0E27_38675 [Streptomyces sparsogenes]|uniref:hypothetical protein n=1 Tax=Streptomyces sparsogenes TaxID=67365 RepID=UPI0033C8785A
MDQKTRVRFNPRSTTTDQPPTAWPEDVIARYLTAGGSTVDLSYDTRSGTIAAVCTGELCGWADSTDTKGRFTDTPEQEQQRFQEWLPVAKKYANDHAEKCRAMPRPTA